MAPIRIVLAEDHTLVREATAHILSQQPDMQVVGEACDGQEALDLILSLRPDVAVLDIRMPVMSALEVLDQLKCHNVRIPVLLLTAHDDDGLIAAAFRAGVAGYLLKTVSSADLIDAVRVICQGEVVLHPVVAKRLARLAGAGGYGSGTEIGFSGRQAEVLDLLLQGLRNRQIAERMGISPRTVEGHVRQLLRKLGVPSRTMAAIRGTTAGYPKEV